LSIGKVMANTKRVQFRRGTDAEHQVFTGAPGEITVNTSNNTIHVHDGVTPGGTPSARQDLTNVTSGIITGTLAVGGGRTSGISTNETDYTHEWSFSVGVGSTVAASLSGGLYLEGGQTVAGASTITGPVEIGDTLTVGGNTNITGITTISGESFNVTTGAASITVGAGSTHIILDGDTRITGILSIGQGTITIDGEKNKITSHEVQADVITSTDFNFVSVAETTFTHTTNTADEVIGFGTIFPVTGLSSIRAGDFFSVEGFITDAKVISIGDTTVSANFTKNFKYAVLDEPISVGSTIIVLDNTDFISIGNSITVGTIQNAPILGISTILIRIDNLEKKINGEQLILQVVKVPVEGSNTIAIGSSANVAIGDSIDSGTGGIGTVGFSTNGIISTEEIISIGITTVGETTLQTGNLTCVGLADTLGQTLPAAVAGVFTALVSGFSNITTDHYLEYSYQDSNVTETNTIVSLDTSTNIVTVGSSFTENLYDLDILNAKLVQDGYFNVSKGNLLYQSGGTSGSSTVIVSDASNVAIGDSISLITGDITTEQYFLPVSNVNAGSSEITITGSFGINIDQTHILELYSNTDSYPTISIGSTISGGINTSTTLGVTTTFAVYGPAITISGLSTSDQEIAEGTTVSISTFTNIADTVLIRPAAASSETIPTGTNISARRESSSNTVINPASSIIGELNVTGIATIGELTFPIYDGQPGQVLQTDGNGNIVFGAGGNSGSDTIIFVSATNGDDDNDGILLPVKTIKKGAQLASKVQKTEVSVLVETGEYLEDNPIIVYDNVSIIGDSLRNIVVRPLNAGKDLFKVRNGCYITGMTFNDFVDGDTKVPQHTWDYAIAFDDPFDNNLDRTGYASTEILKLTNAVYTKETGITTVTTEKNHEFYRGNTVRVAGIAWTCGYDETAVKDIVYNEITGVSTLTFYSDANFTPNTVGGATSSSKYYWYEGQRLYLNNLPFECSPDHVGVTTGTYPYPGLDDVYGAVYPIIGVNTASKQVTVQGGVSTIPHTYKGWESLGIEEFEYDNISGICTVRTRYEHNLEANDNITLIGLGFTCDSEHTGITTTIFPDGTLNAFNKDGYTFKVNTSGVTAEVTDADYDGVSGIITITSANHGMTTGDKVRISDSSIVFTCDQDDNETEHAYPRPTDPASGAWLVVTVVDTDNFSVDVGNAGTASTSIHTFVSAESGALRIGPDKFTVNVGPSTIAHTYEGFSTVNVTGFTYDAYTGISTLTTNATTGVEVGDFISLSDLTLSCTDQSKGINKIVTSADYDHISGIVTVVTADAHDLRDGNKIHLEDLRFECDNSGVNGISVYPKGQYFTPTNAVYDTAAGTLEITIGSHNLTTDDYIDIADNSIAFTCDMDSNDAVKTYPRPGIDPYAGRSISIASTTSTSITVNVGSAGTNVNFTPSTGTYDPVSGLMTLTIGQHGLGVGRGIVLANNSVWFTSDADGNSVPKTFPRPGTDDAAGKSLTIESVGVSTHTATDAPYNAATGAVTVTVPSHGFANGDFIKVADNSLTYTCVLDGNVAQKSYPRKNYDYASGRWLRVSNVTTNTFDINIGASSYTGAHTFVSASTNGIERQTGTITFNFGTLADTTTHNFYSANANAVQHEPQAAHTFVSAGTNAVAVSGKDLNVLSVLTNRSFTVNVGPSTIAHSYLDGGVLNRYYTPKNNVTAAVYDNVSGVTTVTAPGSYFNPGETVYLRDLTFSCQSGQSVYPSGNLGYGFTVTSVTDNSFENFTFVCNTGTASDPHTYVSGGTVQSGITTTIFPDGTSFPRDAFEVLAVNNATEVELQVGKSDIPHTWASGGTAKQVSVTRKVGTVQQVQYYPELNQSGKIDFGVVNSLNNIQFLFRGETNERDHFYTQGGQVQISKPKINKSPYVQNCSILSSLGGNGILVDGDKIIDTNRGLIPELGEIPAVLPSPEFGKSMVAATFTMISFGGIGWRTINDGYAQVVSCFQIFCGYGSLCQSGGYLSITNSATNFGRFSLRATGFSRNSFVFDRGRVVDTGTSGGLQTLRVVGLGRSDQQLYVLKFLNNVFEDKTADYKPVTVSQTFTGSNISTTTNTFNIPGHPFQNEDSIIYLGNEDATPRDIVQGLVNNGIYYVGYIDASNFQIYLDEGLDTLVNIGSTITGINTFTANSVEFFVDDIIEHHTSYQQLQLSNVTGSDRWVDGREVTQSGSGAVGFAVTYLPNVNSLIVSVEEVGGVRNLFNTASTIQCHDLGDGPSSQVAIGVTGVVGLTTYHTINFKVNATDNAAAVIGIASLVETYRCHFHRPSIINSSAHTWEYSGSGTDYNALPQNGGQSQPNTEQISELGGRVFASGTTELGDFKIGDQITAFNRTGSIIFNNKVTIGELDSIRLSLSGGVAIEEFSTDVGLGENETGGPQNKRVSTQLAVRSFLSNRLGTFIDKVVSTNAIPNAVVQLNSNGQINSDLIPPKVVNFVQTNVAAGRTVLVNEIPAYNIIQGDTVVEPDDAYVLVNDTIGQYLIIDKTYNGSGYIHDFNNGDIITSALSSIVTGVVTAPPGGIGIGTTIAEYTGYGSTGYVRGVGLGLNISNAGSGYITAGIYTGVPVNSVTGNGTGLLANITVSAGGQVNQIDVLAGGKGYQTNDLITVSNSSLLGGRSGGADFQATITDWETRLYVALTNRQKFAGSAALNDYIADGNSSTITTSLTASYSVPFDPTDIAIGGDVDFANSRIIVGAGNQYADGDPVLYNTNGNNILVAGGQGILNLTTYYTKIVGAGTSIEIYRNYSLTDQVEFTGSGGGTHEFRRDTVRHEKNTIVWLNHGYGTGHAIRVSGQTPLGISTGAFYYTGSITQNSFTLHETASDAGFSAGGVIFNEVGIASSEFSGGPGDMTFASANVRYNDSVNTSSTNVNNWSLLARQDIDASNIISGIINTSRLGGGTANSDTVLTGGSAFLKNVFKVGVDANSPITMTSSSQDFPNGGTGIVTHYGTVNIGIVTAAATNQAYSTKGFANFKTSTFDINTDGGVSVKTAAGGGDIDAVTLESRSLAYVLNSANHTGAIPVTRGGTGLSAAPSIGAILVGNGSGYNLVTSPTFTGRVTLTSTASYPLTFNSSVDAKIVLGGSNYPYIRWREGSTDRAYIQWQRDYDALLIRNQQSHYTDFMGSGSSVSGSRYRTNNGSIRGYVYANSSNDIGFLDADGNWAYRHRRDSWHYFYVNSTHYSTINSDYLWHSSDVRTPIFYDNDNTGYYLNMASVRSSNINGFTSRTKMALGLTYKWNVGRADYTSDTNYWVGTMGWGTTDMNSVFDWGSGFTDSWSNPGNQPSGTSHWVGVQTLHYTNGSGRYGWQMVGGPIGNLRFRSAWNGLRPWRTIPVLDENNTNGGSMYAGIYYDSNNTGYYCNPNSWSNMHRGGFVGYNGRTTSGNWVSLEISNSGGTGDNAVAAMSYHCRGSYAVHAHLRADGWWGMGGWSASAWRWYVYMPTGRLYANGFSNTSDERLKENLEPITNAIEKIQQIQGYTFTWKDMPDIVSEPGKKELGFIAQEVELVYPELIESSIHEVDPNEDGSNPDSERYKVMDYPRITPLLLEGIKEQAAEIAALKARLDAAGL
jgi:hypothetical protein